MPLVNNWQGKEIRTGAEAREGLFQQVPNPVLWSDSIAFWPRKQLPHAKPVEVGAERC